MIIDKYGYRSNVGIILIGPEKQLFWARCKGRNAWQFPQGGISENETPTEAMYRELYEEVGLTQNDVALLGVTQNWLYYRLPKSYQRCNKKPLVVGQRQKWFLLSFLSDENKVCLDVENKPEFDAWRWVDYWYPLEQVIYFKRDVYRKALEELTVFVK